MLPTMQSLLFHLPCKQKHCWVPGAIGEDGFWPAKIIAEQISAMERNEHTVLYRL